MLVCIRQMELKSLSMHRHSIAVIALGLLTACGSAIFSGQRNSYVMPPPHLRDMKSFIHLITPFK